MHAMSASRRHEWLSILTHRKTKISGLPEHRVKRMNVNRLITGVSLGNGQQEVYRRHGSNVGRSRRKTDQEREDTPVDIRVSVPVHRVATIRWVTFLFPERRFSCFQALSRALEDSISGVSPWHLFCNCVFQDETKPKT